VVVDAATARLSSRCVPIVGNSHEVRHHLHADRRPGAVACACRAASSQYGLLQVNWDQVGSAIVSYYQRVSDDAAAEMYAYTRRGGGGGGEKNSISKRGRVGG